MPTTLDATDLLVHGTYTLRRGLVRLARRGAAAERLVVGRPAPRRPQTEHVPRRAPSSAGAEDRRPGAGPPFGTGSAARTAAR